MFGVSKLIGFMSIQGICFLFMAGCMVGPDFHKPETTLPQSWYGIDSPAAPAISVAVAHESAAGQWWNNFDDPVLSSLVDRTVKANLDVRIAQSRIRQARAARGVAAAGLWPEIDASADYSYNRGTLTGNNTSVGWVPGYKSSYFQAGLDASWELDFFGGVRRNVEASQADLQAAVEDRRDVLVTLLGDVGTNYLNLRCFQQQIDIARSNLKSQRRTVEIVRRKHQAGLVSALDLANASAQVAQTESQIPILESSAQGAIYALSLLMAREPAALVQELITGKPIPMVPPEIPVGLPSELLRRRPDIRRAEAAIHAATARVGVATADLFPKFSLTGSYGFSGLSIGTLANWQSAAWSVGPSVRWPIFDAGRIRWNIEGRNAEEEQALLAYNKTVLAALKDVETSMFAYAREQERRKTLIEEMAQNQKAFDLSMKLYVVGKGDFLNVLIAERALYTSQDALAQSARTLSVDLVSLYKALGGGWENLP
jgi:NodT family efflux transporter outer membrane factor (OMF) lipoprotein